jgi:hypothetical protein
MRKAVGSQDSVAMAGWLFADLLLGVAMLFFVFNTVGELPAITPEPPVEPTETPTPTATATPTSTPTVSPTSTPSIASTVVTITPTPTMTRMPSLNSNPTIVRVSVDMEVLLGNDNARKEAERTKVLQAVQKELSGIGHRQAGIVLTFGTTRHNEPERGDKLAREVNTLLKEGLPHIFGRAVLKSYHQLSGDPASIGDTELEIYWLSE